MSNPVQDDILSILAHVVIADNVVRTEQVDAFIKGAQQLNLHAANGQSRSRRWLMSWFKSELPRLKSETENHHVHKVWRDQFVRLRELDNTQNILHQMCAISNAYGRPHTNEQLLVALAAGHWDVRSPAWFDATG